MIERLLFLYTREYFLTSFLSGQLVVCNFGWLLIKLWLPPELICKLGEKIGAFCILGVILSCCSTKVSQRDPL